MVNSVTKDFSRISFHDSSIEKIERNKNGSIEISFDWAFINDYSEIEIQTPVIVGKSVLTLNKVKSQHYIKYLGENKSEEISCPEDLDSRFSLIGTNDFTKDGEFQLCSLGGFYENATDYFFIDWKIGFESGKFSWTNYVTYEDWLNGAIPM
jgi:hypothetical protein